MVLVAAHGGGGVRGVGGWKLAAVASWKSGQNHRKFEQKLARSREREQVELTMDGIFG